MASSEGTSGGDSALFSKLGGAFFGGSNSPQKVIANVRGLLANRLTGAIPDTGKQNQQKKKRKRRHLKLVSTNENQYFLRLFDKSHVRWKNNTYAYVHTNRKNEFKSRDILIALHLTR